MLCDSSSKKAYQSERKIGRGEMEDEVGRLLVLWAVGTEDLPVSLVPRLLPISSLAPPPRSGPLPPPPRVDLSER